MRRVHPLLDPVTFTYDKTPEVYSAVFKGPWVAIFSLLLSNRFNTQQALSPNKDTLQFYFTINTAYSVSDLPAVWSLVKCASVCVSGGSVDEEGLWATELTACLHYTLNVQYNDILLLWSQEWHSHSIRSESWHNASLIFPDDMWAHLMGSKWNMCMNISHFKGIVQSKTKVLSCCYKSIHLIPKAIWHYRIGPVHS